MIGPKTESPPSQGTPPVKRRATEPVITAKLATVLDKCKISKRDAVHLLMASAEAVHLDSTNLILNDKSIHKPRRKFWEQRYDTIKNLAPAFFSSLTGTLHWDSEMLAGILRSERLDRLAIIVTSQGLEQLLGIPAISSTSGENQA